MMFTKTPSKAFAAAFVISFLLIFVWNLFSYIHLKANPPQMDWYEECGFPFGFYGLGGFVGISQFLWIGLVVDFLFATVLSVSVGAMWDRILKAIQAKDRNI